MEKHPSSLAALADIFKALAETFSNGSYCFEILLAENIGNWKLFDKYFCFSMKNIISSSRYYICTEVLPFLIFADITYFQQWPCLDESSAILSIEAYFLHFPIASEMSRIVLFLAEIKNSKILLAETF